jgi:hypothetical protein
MTEQQFYTELRDRFERIINARKLSAEHIKISSKALSAEEAIGITKRRDFPIITGKEILLQAEYLGSFGQAFTDSPAVFNGTLGEILALDLNGDVHARGLFIAALNAVLRHLSLASGTIHCKNEEPELCAKQFVNFVSENYGTPKIALVGFQPALIENLAAHFTLRVLDLNADNIGKTKYGVLIEDGIKDYDAVIDWAELVLCTGSTVSNGSIVNFIGLEKPVVFFGTTLAGTAELMGLQRACFCCR